MGNCLRVTEIFLISVLLFVPPFVHLSYGQVFMYKYMYKQKRDLPAKLRWCLDLSDGKIFTTMEWLMVFVLVPL